MKIRFAVIILFLFISNPAIAVNILAPDYSYSQMKDYIKARASFSELENWLDVDNIVSDELKVKFVYTDLSECLKYALNDNYDIKIKTKLSEQKLWNYRNSVVKIVPNIHYDYSRQDLRGDFLVGGIVPVAVHEIATNIYFNAEWDWFQKGMYFFNLFQNKYLLKSAKANLKYTRDEAIFKTAIAYYDLLQAKLEIETYRANVFELRYYKQIAEARYNAGLDKKYDVKRAEADLAVAEKNYVKGINNLRMKQAQLAYVMGLESLCPIYPYETEVSPRELVNKDYDPAKLFFIALNSREDIKALKAQIKADTIKKNSGYSDLLPNVTLSYNDGLAGTRRTGLSENSSLMFTASISLGKNMLAGTITQMKADSAYVKSQELTLEKKKQEIQTLILASYLSSDNAKESILSSKKELEAAQESLSLAIGSYKAGQTGFSDVLDAQELKTQAKLNVIRSSIDYNKSQIQLLFESGLITYNGVLAHYERKHS